MRNHWKAAAAACATAVAMATGEAQATTTTNEAVTLTTATGVLSGTLMIPAGAGARPLVVIIAGSGPTDRNGNAAGAPSGSDAYRILADSLANHGIASLRYDKRGIAASRGAGGSESGLRFERLADDAAQWVAQARTSGRFSRIVIAGHSEGSLLGMLAAQITGADAFISLAGPARRADLILHEQLARNLPPTLLAQSDSILASLVRGDTVPSTPAPLAALFRASVQPYLISWLHYDGATEIAKLRIPVLIVQGAHDAQVAPREADLLAAAAPTAKVARLAGMNHVLKLTPAALTEQMRSYTDPTVPIAPELVATLVTFISGLQGRR